MKTDDVSTYSKSLGDSFGGTFGDESITIEFNSQFCTICHNLVANEIYYENDATFCSESCWLKAITIALDDFVVGGMSTWPLSTFVSQASKSIILNLAASTYDGDLITKVSTHFSYPSISLRQQIVNKFKSSLSESTFQSILLKNPVAAFHFLNFLRQTGQLIRLKKYMKLLGFIRESEIPSYNQLMQKLMNLSSGHVDEVNKYLMQIAEYCELSEVASNPTVKFIFEISSELAVILDYQNSYEREWSLHYNELHTNANTQKLATTLPKSLLMQPLCETLSALVRMDHSLKSNSRAEVLGKKCKARDFKLYFKVADFYFK
ncbi:hypothetical protein KSF78_0001600 [Schistosoma japonicum]|nr:hypothetical protein KSF78_0001600 [Schistosoma japonicum]